MRKEYDFSEGRRGAVAEPEAGKTRITIRIDDEVLKWFKTKVHEAGGGNYQTLMNSALREYIGLRMEDLDARIRRLVREEMSAAASVTRLGPTKAKTGEPRRLRRRATSGG